jgi:hypothetical protein
VKDEMRKIGQATIREEQENLGSREFKIIRTRCNDIERQKSWRRP